MRELTPIRQGIKNVGNQRKVAEAMGVTAPAVNKWVRKNKVPAERVIAFSKLTGVPRWCVAPDLYPFAEEKHG